MYQRLEEFLSARHARYEIVEHPVAVSAQEQAAASHASGHTFAKVLIVSAIVSAATGLDVDRRLLLARRSRCRRAATGPLFAGAIDGIFPGSFVGGFPAPCASSPCSRADPH